MILRLTALVLAIGFGAVSAQAEPTPEPLLGVWGTAKHCLRELLTETGTKRANPFQITDGWMQHGDVWCRLFLVRGSRVSAN